MSRPSYDVAAASLPLRPYQQCALSIVQSFISSCCLKTERIKNDRPFTSSSPLRCTDDGVEQAKIGITQSALLYLPTGGGKTRIAAALTLWTRKQGGRTLFIVNRLQLAIQAKEAFLREGIDADDIGVIEKGSQRGFGKPVIIATIQSLSSRRRRRIKQQHQHLVTLSSYKEEEEEEGEEEEEEEGEAGLDYAEDDNNDNDRNREDDEDFPLADFVVIDEAHGAVSNSFAPLVDFYLSSKGASRVEWLEDNLGQSRKFNRTFLLGMTATPTRLQGEERLEKVFERLIRGPSVSQLVRDGVLVPPIPIRASHELTQNASKALLQKAMRERQLIVHPFGEDDDIGVSLKRKTADDLSLQTTLEEQKVLNHVVLTWKHYCYQTNDMMIIADTNMSQKGPIVSKTTLTTETTAKPTTRRSIVFASSVNHSQAIVAAFTAHGVLASHVDGNTSASDRECIYENMRQGNIDVLSSVGVICEGYDEPSVSCVVLLRPTASRGLYVQQVGRGLRSFQGKKDCLVLDFVDNSLRHGPVTVPINCALDSSSTSLSSTYIDSAEAWVCSDSKCCAISHAAETVCLYCKLPRYGRSSTSSSSSSSTSSSSMKNNVSILSAKPIRMQQTKSPYEQGFESISLNASDFFPPPTEANSQEDVDSLVSAISTLALGGGSGGGGGGGGGGVPGGGKNVLLGIHNTTAQSVIGGNKNSDTVKSDAVRSVGIPIRRPFHSNAEVVRNYTHNNNNTHNNQGLARVPVRPPSSHPPPPPPLPPSSLESNTVRVGSVVSSVSVSPLNGSNTTSSGNNASGSNMSSQSNTSSTQPQKNLLNNGNGGPSHSATPDIFTNSAFQSACARHSLNHGELNLLDNFSFIYQDKGWMKQKSGSRWIHTHSGVSDFDASFLLSIAAQITPHVEHEWKNKGAEQSKGLSEKQLGHLASILKKVQTYHNQHHRHHHQQKSSTLVTSTSTEENAVGKGT